MFEVGIWKPEPSILFLLTPQKHDEPQRTNSRNWALGLLWCRVVSFHLIRSVLEGLGNSLHTRDCKYWLRWQMELKNDTIRMPPCLKRNGSLPIVGNQSKSRPSPSRCWMLMFGNRRTQQVCVHSTARRDGWLTVYLCLRTWHYNRHVTIFATGTIRFWFLVSGLLFGTSTSYHEGGVHSRGPKAEDVNFVFKQHPPLSILFGLTRYLYLVYSMIWTYSDSLICQLIIFRSSVEYIATGV